MEQIHHETEQQWEAAGERLREKASAYAGFNIDEPQDFSEMSVMQVSSEPKTMYSGRMHFELTTKLFTNHMVDGENCPVEITIVRKSVKIPNL